MSDGYDVLERSGSRDGNTAIHPRRVGSDARPVRSLAFEDDAGDVVDLATALASAGIDLTLGETSGTDSLALGPFSQAQGNHAVALGESASATEVDATALGGSSQALASDTTAVGFGAYVDGIESVAVGRGSYAPGSSVAVGKDAFGYVDGTVALGHNAEAQEAGSLALGTGTVVATVGLARIGTDALAFGATSGTVPDAALSNGEMTVEMNETAGAFVLRGKDSTGTVRTAQVAWQ
ncbi:hypothetical protein [Halomarina oriensis]|uniref:Trimeric autotransporter adhesin YadA-like head domain-containing protein n=1 Tax=Halomarina oriensis TaxID=671145 RepID=A0A6B0GEL7_9EURY|nr:hypothetical protein [Halomarina oriensis]